MLVHISGCRAQPNLLQCKQSRRGPVTKLNERQFYVFSVAMVGCHTGVLLRIHLRFASFTTLATTSA